MTWLAPKLNRRIDFCKPIQNPESDGSFERDYEVIISVWAGLEVVNPLSYIRQNNIGVDVTHRIIVRNVAVKALENLSGEETLNPLKTNYFIFLRQESTSRGRRFIIKNVSKFKEEDEYYILLVQELEEEGI